MARISKPPEERKQELIEAAKSLFLSQGYERTAVNDIVRQVGVAQGLFYYYFHSKQDIFLAVIDQFIKAFIAELAEQLCDLRILPLERIHNLLRRLSDFLRELEGIYPPAQTGIATKMYAIIQNHVCEVMEPIAAELLKEGTAQGVMDAPYPERMARFVIAGFIGVESMPMAPQAGEMMDLIQLTVERLFRVPKQALDSGTKNR